MDVTEQVRNITNLQKLKDNLQAEVSQKTQELEERVQMLERFHAATIKRELRIKELRDEIALLKGQNK